MPRCWPTIRQAWRSERSYFSWIASTACRRRSGAISFADAGLRLPRRRPPAPASPGTRQPRAGAIERSRAPDPSSDGPGRSAGHRTPCASDSNFAQRSPPPGKLSPNSYPAPSTPQSGAASAPPAPHPSFDLATCPAPSVLADPLNQPGPKPAGQVTTMGTSSNNCALSPLFFLHGSRKRVTGKFNQIVISQTSRKQIPFAND